MKFPLKLLGSGLAFTLLLVLVPTFYANADTGDLKFVNNNNIKITNSDFDRLVRLGFTDDEIKDMDQEEYDLNKDEEGKEISSQTKYYKTIEYSDTTVEKNKAPLIKRSANTIENYNDNSVTIELGEDEYNKEVESAKKSESANKSNKIGSRASDSDSKSTSYKKMTTSIISLSSSNYRIKNTVTWNITPKNRGFDVIGAAHNANFSANKNKRYGKQTWSGYDYTNKKNSSGSSTYSAGSSYWDLGPNGSGVKMNLKNDDYHVNGGYPIGHKWNTIKTYMYFEVGKNTTSATRIDAYGRYAHSIKTIASSFSFSIGLGGPGVNFNGSLANKFQYTHNTQATIRF